LEVGETGVYNISHRGLEVFSNGACIALEDLLTGIIYPLNQHSEIPLQLNAGNTDLRFQLRIGGTKLAAVTSSGCPGLNNGTATVAISEGNAYDLTWLNQAGEVIHSASTVTSDYEISGLENGMYTLQIHNNGVCGTTETVFFVDVQEEINAEATVIPSTCPSTNDGNVVLNITGGEGKYNVQWSNGTQLRNLENVAPGEYTAFISDLKGCNKTILVSITSENNLVSSFETTQESYELKNGAATVDFYNTSENANTYKWNFGDVTIENNETNPSHVFNKVGIYDVKLVAANGDCETYSTKSIKITNANNSIPEFASEIIGTLTEEGAQLMFFFNTPRKLKISAYNVLGQQLIEPMIGVYERQTISFSEKRYASNALIEVLDMNSGERTVIRLAK